MFAAAAVRNKKRKQQAQNAANAQRGPYIKPFGPRFDPSELPYFRYKRALAEAKELQQNISKAKKAKVKAAKAAKAAAAAQQQPGRRTNMGDALRSLQQQADGVGGSAVDGEGPRAAVREATEKLKVSC